MSRITQLLREIAGGSPGALDQLLPLVEDEMHKEAERLVKRERPGHTLQPTALVHEVYIHLVEQKEVACEDRNHFLAVASKKMREILKNYARDRRALKRGRGWGRIPLDESIRIGEDKSLDLVALDQALDHLEATDRRASRIIEMRLFAGMESSEIAATLGVSTRTVQRDYEAAKLILFNEVTGDQAFD